MRPYVRRQLSIVKHWQCICTVSYATPTKAPTQPSSKMTEHENRAWDRRLEHTLCLYDDYDGNGFISVFQENHIPELLLKGSRVSREIIFFGLLNNHKIL